MDQVLVSVLLTFESNEEAMREALIQIFGAVVRSPLEAFDQRNLFCESGERILNLFYVGRLGAVFEFEHHYVS